MGFTDWWLGLSPEIQAAIVGAAATAITGFLGFCAIVLQIGAQAKQSRGAIHENERRQLKTKVYEDALIIGRGLSDKAIELSNMLRLMKNGLSLTKAARAIGNTAAVPDARYAQIHEKYGAFSDAALRLIFLIEARRIIDARLLIFRTALSVVLHDTRQIMFSEYPAHLWPALPVDNPAGGVFPYTAPPAEIIDRAIDSTDRLIDSLSDAMAYAEDFLGEMQNLCLGELFESSVEPRAPIDPAKRAITLARAEDLESWFRTTTDWVRVTTG